MYRVAFDVPPELRAAVERDVDLPRWKDYPGMDLELLRQLAEDARAQAKGAADTEGFFSARVATSVEEDGAQWVVRIAVEPGERTHVASVDIRFTGPFLENPDAAERMRAIRAAWSLPPGAAFRQVDWARAKEEAVRLLAMSKYAAAHIGASEARIDPDTRAAALTVELASGPVFRYGSLEVLGTNRYPRQIVERLNPLKQGAEYSEQELALFRRRLLELGQFATVEVAVDRDPAQAAAAPVNVAVIEGQAKRIDTSVGFTTDAGARFRLDYSDADLLDQAWRLRSQLSLEQKIQSVRASVDSQPLAGGAWNTLLGRLERKDVEGQTTQSASVGLARQWGLERLPSALSVSWHNERQQVGDTPKDTTWATFVDYRYTFRRADDIASPRTGYQGTFNLGAAVPGLSSRGFVRATAKLHGFVPVGRNGDLALRAEAGHVLASTREGVPAEFMFRTGGDQTLRGYAFESIGLPVNGAVASARWLALASVEYTQWFSELLGGAVFYDIGDAFDTRDAFSAKSGVGVGLRIRSPIGPFRVDVAYGEATHQLRLHFSVGFSF
ncbi:MAG: BamA/TamA family outer membrane protein [Burkholderiales bacterium]|nr:BamA/TamA family outer membrane protein [Burkholderiales bacterium]